MIKLHLKSAAETLLFMKSGVDGFDGSVRAAWISMLIPVLLTIGAFWLLRGIQPLGAEETDPLRLGMAAMLVRWVSLGVFLVMIYGFARLQSRQEGFPRFVTASNWAALLFTILASPAIFLKLGESIDRQTYEDLMIWVLIYGYAVTGFIIWRCLRVSWELAAALSVFALFIDQASRGIVFQLLDIPIVDYFDIY